MVSEIDFFVTCARPSEQERTSTNLSNGLTYGTTPATIDEANELMENSSSIKRSQSSSSIDEQSPPHGSPKPVLRRKNKPAPVPPALLSKTSPTPQRDTSAEKDHSAQLTKTNSFKSNIRNSQLLGEPSSPGVKASMSPGVEKEKREGGIWVPPSPSQLATRKLNLGSESALPTGRPPSMAPPPKPPQPQFDASSRARFSSVPVQPNEPPPKPSPLKYKSSFKTSASIDSPPSTTASGDHPSPVRHNTTDNIDSSTSSSSAFPNAANQFSSLPRHFSTDNSYKNQRAPRPPSIFSVAPNVPPPQPPVAPVSLPPTHIASINAAQSEPEKGREEFHIGFEKLEQEVRKSSTDKSGEESSDEISKASLEMSSVLNCDNNNSPLAKPEQAGGAPNPPVPIPRSSIIHGSSPPTAGKEGHQPPVARERPSLMAKPRDLPKRTQSQNKGLLGGSAAVTAINAASPLHELSSGGESDNQDSSKDNQPAMNEDSGEVCRNGKSN